MAVQQHVQAVDYFIGSPAREASRGADNLGETALFRVEIDLRHSHFGRVHSCFSRRF